MQFRPASSRFCQQTLSNCRSRFSCFAWEDSSLDIATARTPPAQWYFDPEVHEADFDILSKGWRLASIHHLAPGTFHAGSTLNIEYLITRDDEGILRGFHNVCSHHAAVIAAGRGQASSNHRFVCPYHGWQYDRCGRLVHATQLRGIKGFRAKDYGLPQFPVANWGHHFTFMHVQARAGSEHHEELHDYIGKESSSLLMEAGVGSEDLVHVRTHVYKGIKCNWKVFCDNYLDGGYHVPFAHKGLADSIDMESYESLLFENVSIQRVHADTNRKDIRLLDANSSRAAAYAFIFPNVMINRYGSWMDTNVVWPTSATTCDVAFDWWVDKQHAEDSAYIHESLHASDIVQQEDIALCESIQRGVQSVGFRRGRYAPSVETPMFHFHQLLHQHYQGKS